MTGSDSESLFDGLDDFLDLPNGDIDSAFSLVPNCNALFDGSTLWPSQSGSLQPPNDGVFSCNSATNPCAERDLPIEDIVQLEWLSNFCDDSFSGERHTINEPDNSVEKDVQQIPGLVVPVKPRSKRPRPATFNPHSAIHLIFPASSVTEAEALQHQPLLPPKVHSDYEKFAGSRPAIKIRKQASRKQKKKKKIKQITLLLAEAEGNQSSGTTQGAVKQVKTCCHCKTTHTPQWRIGPKDRETLCNACGIRYRSGNLYPEYRPLGSPTFVPTRDSRSFKKVLEMRNKGSELVPFGETTTATTDTTEHIPNTDHSISLTCDREEDVVEDNVP